MRRCDPDTAFFKIGHVHGVIDVPGSIQIAPLDLALHPEDARRRGRNGGKRFPFETFFRQPFGTNAAIISGGMVMGRWVSVSR
jgi:hypothetical protein